MEVVKLASSSGFSQHGRRVVRTTDECSESGAEGRAHELQHRDYLFDMFGVGVRADVQTVHCG